MNAIKSSVAESYIFQYCIYMTDGSVCVVFFIINQKYKCARFKQKQRLGCTQFKAEVCNLLRHWWGRVYTSALNCVHPSRCFCLNRAHLLICASFQYFGFRPFTISPNTCQKIKIIGILEIWLYLKKNGFFVHFIQRQLKYSLQYYFIGQSSGSDFVCDKWTHNIMTSLLCNVSCYTR